MADSINLYQDQSSQKKKKGSPFDSTLALIFALLAMILLAYGGVWYMERSVRGEIGSIRGQMEERKAGIDEETLRDVNDGYLRMQAFGEGENLLGKAIGHLEVLERTTVPKAVVTEYAYDVEEYSKSARVSMLSDFLDGASEQVASFRESEDVSTINVSSMSLTEEGVVSDLILSFSGE